MAHNNWLDVVPNLFLLFSAKQTSPAVRRTPLIVTTFSMLLFCPFRRISRGIFCYFRGRKKMLSVVAKWAKFRTWFRMQSENQILLKLFTCIHAQSLSGCNSFLPMRHKPEVNAKKLPKPKRMRENADELAALWVMRACTKFSTWKTLLFVGGKFKFANLCWKGTTELCNRYTFGIIVCHDVTEIVQFTFHTWTVHLSTTIPPLPPSHSPCSSWYHVWHTFGNANPVVVYAQREYPPFSCIRSRNWFAIDATVALRTCLFSGVEIHTV